MKTILRAALVLLAGALHVSAATMSSSHLIFLGTYTRNGSRGIYAVRLDGNTGALGTPTLVAESPDPAWITFSPDKKFLYAIHPSQAQAVGFAVDAEHATLTPLPAAKAATAAPPSHLAVDPSGRVLLAANYREGYVASMAVHADGTLGAPTAIKHSGKGPNPTRQGEPHTHSVTVSPDGRYVIVCDLGLDKIFSYAIDPATAGLTPANPPYVATTPGAGPRHFKFGADGRYAYAINEMGNSIAAYRYAAETGTLTPLGGRDASTLPADFKGENTCAEIRVHPSGKFLVGSNRGHDSLAVFEIRLPSDGTVPFDIDETTGVGRNAEGELRRLEIVPSGGKVPRNFAFSPDGAWLVCAHQDSANLTVFKVDQKTGRLTRTKHEAAVPMCVCVLFHD